MFCIKIKPLVLTTVLSYRFSDSLARAEALQKQGPTTAVSAKDIYQEVCNNVSQYRNPIFRNRGFSKFPVIRTKPKSPSPVNTVIFTPDFWNLPIIQTNLLFLRQLKKIGIPCSMYSSFQLLKDVQPGDEVEILTGLGKTFLSLDDITQATEVSNEYLLYLQ